MRHFSTLMILMLWASQGISFGQPTISPATFMPRFEPDSDWKVDGEIRLYDESDVYEYINGEAELFYPFGFESVAAAVYVRKEDENRAVAVSLFKMGEHPLEAYGIYSNNRDPEAVDPGIGFESALNDYQLMFVKDRYFVRMSAYGEPETNREDLQEIGGMLNQRLPQGNPALLAEWLELVLVAGQADPQTVQYQAQSLLGYQFLPCGLEARTEIEGAEARAILAFYKEGSEVGLKSWAANMEKAGAEVKRLSGRAPEWTGILGKDPLYGQVLALSRGEWIFALVGLEKAPEDLNQFATKTIRELQQKWDKLSREPKPPWE
jgi:hypothetical protein